MAKPLRVLVVEDSEDDVLLVTRELRQGGFDVSWERVETREAMSEALDRGPWDLILSDFRMPRFSAPEALAQYRERGLETPFIIVSGTVGEEQAVESLKAGAHDFFLKDGLARLCPAVQRELRETENRRARRRAEENLRASEARFKGAFASSPIGMALVAPDGRWLEVNPALCQIVGYSEKELLTQTFQDTTHPDDIEADRRCMRQMLAGEIPSYEMEKRYLHRRGNVVWVLVSVSVQRDKTGQPLYFISQIQDITGRKQAERTRQLQSTALNAAANAIVITDRSGVIEWVNPAFARLTGYAADEVIGKTPRLLKSGKHDAAFYGSLWRTILSGEVWRGEMINRRRDGSVYTARETITPVQGETGGITHFVGIKEDITERRAAEEMLRRAQKIEAVGRLAGGVAHDFNNILGVITGYGELAQRQLGPDHPARPRVDQMVKAAERAARLTRQLLAFSRKQVMQPRPLDLSVIVADTQKMLGRLIGEDVEMVVRAAQGLGTVHADPGQVEQIILNLAVNARDAMPKGGSLTLETANVDLDEAYAAAHPPTTPGRYVMLAISDTGVGMDEGTQHRIFEPFFTTKREGEGTGLGLATVYGIVKQSGGHIWVYSEPDRGTTFKVYLPRVDEPAEAVPSCPALGEAPRGQETILLVEDTGTLQEVIRESLEEKGYTLLVASDGEEALALVRERQGPIDLLLTDVVMPKLGGGDLAKVLLALRPGLRVLYMSGYTDGALSQQGVLGEGVLLLEKPFTGDKLARAVREALDRPIAT